MTIQTPTRKLRPFITHEIGDKTYRRSGGKRVPILAITHAELSHENGQLLGQGNAYCYAGDQFQKKVGVRIAVTRAIAGLSRAERTAIWKRVWNQK